MAKSPHFLFRVGFRRSCLAALTGIIATCNHAGGQEWRGQADWDRTVALARQEGTVAVSGPVGVSWRAALTSFERDYGIKVEYTPARSHEFWPRLMLERSLGKYLWDLRLSPGDTQTFQLLRGGKTLAGSDFRFQIRRV